MKVILILFLISFNCNASTLILEEIQKAIINDYKLEGKIKVVDDVPSPPNVEPKKELSKGEKIVEEQLRQNRERVKQLHKQEAELEKKQNNDFMESKRQETADWQAEKIKEAENWQIEKQKIINQWRAEKEKYIARIPEYKENLVSENDFKSVQATKKIKTEAPAKAVSKKITMPIFPDYFVIDKALDVDIKDQGRRPTCASFSGVRAMEILMSQKGKTDKLSEQYFFWASMPQCQNSPCKKEGSWVINGYQSSMAASSPNIPLNKSCPYSQGPSNDNVTEIPLANGCLTGFAKVKKYSEVQTSAEIVNAIKNGHPVIGGFKLSENFYQNNGYVFQQNAKDNGAKLDEHAAGHAILLVGIMKLPPELQPNEGTFCLISANSWGVGWGKGGHACISERWIEKHRFDFPFVALEQVETI